MSNFIIYKNSKIHFTDEGKGNVILLLHGFLENINMWNNLSPHLIKTNRVICIDLLGHGKSDSIGYTHTMELMADAIYHVLNHLKINNTIIIGHSMGGYVALAFAELYPNLVSGLCLMNSTAKSDSKEKQKNRDRAIKAVKQNHKTFIRVSITNLFRPKNRHLFKEDIKIVKNEALKTSIQGIIAALEGMKIRKDRQNVFSNGNFKKMIIISKKDPILDYQSLIEQVTNKTIKVVELPDGHMSHIENKEAFSYNVMHFIENF